MAVLKLSTKRILFSTAHAKLVLYINSLGYGVATDFVKRCHDCKVGRSNSCHKIGLAADLNIYDEQGKYLDDEHPDTFIIHSLAHLWWDDNGGSERIENDLNHYSFEHNGMW